MQNALLTKFIQKNKRTDIPEFRPGDTIRVHVKIKEGDKERLQAFEGVVIARNNIGMGESITVRKISFSHGAEWKALISRYIGTIPLSGDASRAAAQIISAEPAP